MDIRKYLEGNILLTDGAMGTYYTELTGDKISFCEFANLEKPEMIAQIHKEYIAAGAKLIRTNTFSANTISFSTTKEQVAKVIAAGYNIAKEIADEAGVFVGCSIGPIHESGLDQEEIDLFEEYKFVADTFLNLGADIFIFETFGTLDYLSQITQHIKRKNPEAFVLVQFAVTMDGFTRKGIGIKNIIDSVKRMEAVDAYGFNCGSGPAHLYRTIKNLNIFEDVISVLPNAGYPELENGRMVYVNNPEYFSEVIVNIAELGVKIVGGCCGTTPQHIAKISQKLNLGKSEASEIKSELKTPDTAGKKVENRFWEKLKSGEFVYAVELDPPFNTNMDKLMKNAECCRAEGVDLITVADSPRAISRVDSIMVAAKIMREVGVETIPHLCCRDKNLNALKSGVLGAHIEGIRNILAVTGDPILEIDKLSTKSVFNLNSYELINLIDEMNSELFEADEITIGGALNLNVLNKEAQIKRLNKKVEKGAKVFFTQPIFEDEVVDFLSGLDKPEGVKLMAGIMPIVNYKNAQFLNNEVPGIQIPEHYVNLFKDSKSKEESEQIGIDIAVSIVEKLKNYVDGLYFITPFDRMDIIQKILKRVR